MARYIEIGEVANAIDRRVCKALLRLHSLTGCYTVSAFGGIGKVKPLKLLRKNNDFLVVFQKLGEEWSVSEELFMRFSVPRKVRQNRTSCHHAGLLKKALHTSEIPSCCAEELSTE